MAEWFQKKRAWSEHYFFKKAPNGDSGMGPPNGGTSTDRAPPTTTSQVLVSGERRRTAGLPAPNGNGRPGRNGRDTTGVDQRVSLAGERGGSGLVEHKTGVDQRVSRA